MAETKGRKAKDEDETPERVSVRVLHPDPDHAAGTHDATTPAELNKLVVGLGYTIESGETLAAASERLSANMSAAPATAGTVAEPTTPTPGAGTEGAPSTSGTGSSSAGASGTGAGA